ncbi:DNA-directed RNA polymerase subunit H RpoH [methanogenic archaeon ISO4-H5]|nr:DNA-directed RNA polymerase subunit H RpoH [methanogenic archaeon ISO4-H5]
MPEHHLLTEEQAAEVLKELQVEKDKLPKIRMDDPAVVYLEQIHGKIQEGSIIKIIRKSETAGEFIAYRLVING